MRVFRRVALTLTQFVCFEVLAFHRRPSEEIRLFFWKFVNEKILEQVPSVPRR